MGRSIDPQHPVPHLKESDGKSPSPREEIADRRDTGGVFLHGEVPSAGHDMYAGFWNRACPKFRLTGKRDPVPVAPHDERFVGYPA